MACMNDVLLMLTVILVSFLCLSVPIIIILCFSARIHANKIKTFIIHLTEKATFSFILNSNCIVRCLGSSFYLT